MKLKIFEPVILSIRSPRFVNYQKLRVSSDLREAEIRYNFIPGAFDNLAGNSVVEGRGEDFERESRLWSQNAPSEHIFRSNNTILKGLEGLKQVGVEASTSFLCSINRGLCLPFGSCTRNPMRAAPARKNRHVQYLVASSSLCGFNLITRGCDDATGMPMLERNAPKQRKFESFFDWFLEFDCSLF